MVRDSRAASIKGWETRRRIESSRGYGPKGRKRGTEAHKVKSVSEIFQRLQGRAAVACLAHNQEVAGSIPAPATNHESGIPSPPRPQDSRTNEAGGDMERKTPVVPREPETTG